MQLLFHKVFQSCKNGEKLPFFVKTNDEKVWLEGVFLCDSIHPNLLKLTGTLQGMITLVCDISGEEYDKELHDSLEFYLSDGIIRLDNGSFEDIVECVDGRIDLDEILDSELEMIRCDYHTKDN